MAKYIKVSSSLVGSVVSDYTRPFTRKDFTYETTGERAPVDEITATGAGVTYPLSLFSSLKTLVIQNQSSTLECTITFRAIGNPGVPYVFVLGPLGRMEFCNIDIDPAFGVNCAAVSADLQILIAPGGT